MSDDETEVEVTGTPDEVEVPTPEIVPPPLADTPSVPEETVAASTPDTAPPVVGTAPPVASVVQVPPEPVAPPPPPPAGDAVAAIDAADDQSRADQAQREAEAFALSTNGIPPPRVLPPPLAGVADLPAAPLEPREDSLWVCVTEEGPRTPTCLAFRVEKIPPQGQLIACPFCGNTGVRRATVEEGQLPPTTVPATVAS